MENQKENNYTVTANYNQDGKKFEEILKTHIEKLTKIPIGDWHLQKYDLKYKW